MSKAKKSSLLCCMIGIVVFGHLSGGCQAIQRRPFRRPKELPHQEVTDILHERTFLFTTLRDTRASLRMEQKNADSGRRYPSLRAILAFDKNLPALYLRAERFGQNIFTLRAHENNFWLELPDSHEIITGSEKAYERMPHLVRPEEILLWFSTPEWLGLTWDSTEMHTKRHDFVFEVKLDGLTFREVKVDRYNLHMNKITEYDIFGNVKTIVELEGHISRNESVFPTSLTVYRPREGFQINLDLGCPEFEEDIDEVIFLPREWRGWDRIDLDRQPAPALNGLPDAETGL